MPVSASGEKHASLQPYIFQMCFFLRDASKAKGGFSGYLFYFEK